MEGRETLHVKSFKTLTQNCESPPNLQKMAHKLLNPRTPSRSSSVPGCSSLDIFAIINTPPAKRFQSKVRNPFEPIMTERLHLPLIASPSLFQRPATPQLSSTHFEWTIDEVSSLKPAHVEPHETQFHDSPDSEYEAKAQSAISMYFKEQQIVPSPVDCPLRNRRIILSELNGDTPISKPGRRIRDSGTQTELSLPFVLPKSVEDALKPYFQPHLALANNCSSEISYKSCSSTSYRSCSDNMDAKDTSLRRKLFDMQNIILLEEGKDSTADNGSDQIPVCNSDSFPVLPEKQHRAFVGKLSDSMDKSSFGSLSPISVADGLSISPRSLGDSASKLKYKMHNYLHDLIEEQLSPIHPATGSILAKHKSLKNSVNSAISLEVYRNEPNSDDNTVEGELSVAEQSGKFAPEQSSSPLAFDAAAETSTDKSFNIKISRLVVNSSKCAKDPVNKSHLNKITNGGSNELYMPNDLDETLDVDDDMQVSQLSTHSSNCSSSQSDTPRCKRRSASRKNLSQSFSLNSLESEENGNNCEQLNKIIAPQGEYSESICPQVNLGNNECLNFYRTDSGFNEMATSSSSSSTVHQQNDVRNKGIEEVQHDISMAYCSTPSKLSGFNEVG